MDRKPSASPGNESELVCRAQAGDACAFEWLVEPNRAKMHWIARKYVRNDDTADDLVQDAFLKAFRALATFDTRYAFLPWLTAIVTNHCLNWLKRESKVAKESIEQLAEERYAQFASDEPNAFETAVSNERKQIVWKAIGKLEQFHRDIIVMAHFHELSYKEMSDALGVPIGTVMSRLFNARRKLADALKDSGIAA